MALLQGVGTLVWSSYEASLGLVSWFSMCGHFSGSPHAGSTAGAVSIGTITFLSGCMAGLNSEIVLSGFWHKMLGEQGPSFALLNIIRPSLGFHGAFATLSAQDECLQIYNDAEEMGT